MSDQVVFAVQITNISAVTVEQRCLRFSTAVVAIQRLNTAFLYMWEREFVRSPVCVPFKFNVFQKKI